MAGRLVFLGTAEFAVPALEALVAAGEDVARVVTQPDRPRGRGRKAEPSPVKRAAAALGLNVWQPSRVNEPAVVAELAGLEPEFLVVVAYGQLLGAPLLNVPDRYAVNVHPSLLPRHRGPSPVAWAILSGDRETGVSTMVLDEGMDSGPVLLQRRFPLDPAQTRGEVEDLLAREGAALLLETLEGVRQGTVLPKPQDEAGIVTSRLLTPELRWVPWARSAGEVRRRIHALAPMPAAVAVHRGKRLKILRAAEAAGSGLPGTVLSAGDDGPVVACGRGAVVLLEVQPEGRRPMSGAAWARGARGLEGDRLETEAGG